MNTRCCIKADDPMDDWMHVAVLLNERIESKSIWPQLTFKVSLLSGNMKEIMRFRAFVILPLSFINYLILNNFSSLASVFICSCQLWPTPKFKLLVLYKFYWSTATHIHLCDYSHPNDRVEQLQQRPCDLKSLK